MNDKRKLEKRIEKLQERISMNNHDIEYGEDAYFRKMSRGDNKFCRERIKELKKELSEINGK